MALVSSTRFKVCCIRDAAEAELSHEHGAAAVGLVSQMPSGPGVIDDTTIADVTRAMTGRVETFLFTAEKSARRIAKQVRQLRPSTVQLVDTLPAAEIATLLGLAPQVSVVTVVHVLGPDSIGKAIRMRSTRRSFDDSLTLSPVDRTEHDSVPGRSRDSLSRSGSSSRQIRRAVQG